MRARSLAPVLALLLAACGGGGGGGAPTGGGGAAYDVVSSVDPPDGSLDVEPSVVVTIHFRTPMDEATLTGGALIVTLAGTNDPVDATVTVPLGAMRVLVAPRAALQDGRDYQVRLSSLARRADGREIGRPWFSDFRVGGGPPPPPPPPPQGGTVLAAADLDTGRSGHAAVLLGDGRVAVFGGYSDSGTVTGSIEVYDPAADLWTKSAATLSPARARLTATRLSDGRVLLAGGETASASDVGTDAFEMWDPATDGMVVSGALVERRTRHRAVLLGNGKVLVAGGARTDSPGAPLFSRTTAEVFDPAVPGSTAAASMGVPRAGLDATLLGDGKVLATGGHGSELRAETFDPATGAWSFAGSMSSARRDHAATLLLDGSVIVCGGNNYTADLWVPASRAFYPMQNMGDLRTLHTAVRIANGRVFVAGGEKPAAGGGTFFHNSTEFYNPASGSFLFPDIRTRVPRSGHTATLLATGEVLLVGGKNPSVGAPAVRWCDRVRF